MAEAATAESVEEPAEDWRNQLPDSVQAWDEAKNAKDADSFWQQLADHRSMLGRSIRIPTDDAGEDAKSAFFEKLQQVDGVVRIPSQEDEEGWKSLWAKMGRPDDHSQYKAEIDEDWKKVAHAAGLSQDQVTRLAEHMNGKSQAEMQARLDDATKEFEQLKADMGPALERKMGNVTKFLNQFDPGGHVQELLKQPETPGTPAMIRMLIKASDMFLEGQSVDGEDGGNSFTVTPAEARQRIAEIRGNKDDVYHKPGHPGHQDRIDYMQKMYAIGYPGMMDAEV